LNFNEGGDRSVKNFHERGDHSVKNFHERGDHSVKNFRERGGHSGKNFDEGGDRSVKNFRERGDYSGKNFDERGDYSVNQTTGNYSREQNSTTFDDSVYSGKHRMKVPGGNKNPGNTYNKDGERSLQYSENSVNYNKERLKVPEMVTLKSTYCMPRCFHASCVSRYGKLLTFCYRMYG
jgi:hypothetical protein